MVLPESLQVEGEVILPPDDEGIVLVPHHLKDKVRTAGAAAVPPGSSLRR